MSKTWVALVAVSALAVFGTIIGWWLPLQKQQQRAEELRSHGILLQQDRSGRVTQINLWPPAADPAAFHLLGDLSHLQTLNLHSSSVTDQDLVYLRELPRLEHIVLQNTAVTDVAIDVLASIESLQRVDLTPSRITPAAALRLRVRRPELTIGVNPLELHGLGHLRLPGGHGELDDEYRLVALDLHGLTIRDEDLAGVGACPDLRMVNLSGTPVGDRGLAFFRDHEQIRELWLSDTAVTDAGLAVVAEFKQLQSISLARTFITDTGLAHLAGLPQLQVVHLGETEVSDEGLQHLKSLTQLQEVYVPDSGVTTEGAKELAEAIPSAQVFGGSEPQKSLEDIESQVLG